jgi:uncharacterized membrane protein YheB (UPF0754 family)
MSNNSSREMNMWPNNEESDDDYNDEDSILNEELPTDIDENFKKNVLNLKHEIYENTVLSPDLGTEEAQNNKVLEDYLENINNVYILCRNAQKGKISNNLNQFPKETRELINNLLIWIADYSKNNQVVDTIPYVDYIQKSFKEHPFVQTNSFN